MHFVRFILLNLLLASAAFAADFTGPVVPVPTAIPLKS